MCMCILTAAKREEVFKGSLLSRCAPEFHCSYTEGVPMLVVTSVHSLNHPLGVAPANVSGLSTHF